MFSWIHSFQALHVETEDDIHLLAGYFVKEIEKEKEASRKTSTASGPGEQQAGEASDKPEEGKEGKVS